MQLTPKQLETHLLTQLLPVYLISGDEPLLVRETRDAIINAAKKQGFSQTLRMHGDSGFKIEALESTLQTMGLFDDKTIIDFRNDNAKFDKALTEIICQFAEKPLQHHLLIITTQKLTAAQQKSAWFLAIKERGAVITIAPVVLKNLPQFIQTRAHRYHMRIDPDAITLLSLCTEGNLLAADQALQKLQLLQPEKTITREDIKTVLVDHAHFSIFDLTTAIVDKNMKKAVRILTRLEQHGEEAILVLWVLTRKIRELLATEPRLANALTYAAFIDETIKGVRAGNVWQALTQLSFLIYETIQ